MKNNPYADTKAGHIGKGIGTILGIFVGFFVNVIVHGILVGLIFLASGVVFGVLNGTFPDYIATTFTDGVTLGAIFGGIIYFIRIFKILGAS